MDNFDIDIRLVIDPSDTIGPICELDSPYGKDELIKLAEEACIEFIINKLPFVASVTILRNNGFGSLLPDESTKVERSEEDSLDD